MTIEKSFIGEVPSRIEERKDACHEGAVFMLLAAC